MTTEPAVRQRRPRRQVLTDAKVAELKRLDQPYPHPDPELGGHYIRVQPDGPPHRYYVIARDAYRKQRWVKLGSTGEMPIEEAREVARGVIKRLRAGEEPFPPPPVKKDSVAAVIDTWLKREVDKKGFRSAAEIKRTIKRHVLPRWRDKVFLDLKRSDVARLVDEVEDRSGPYTADAVLALLKSVGNWFAKNRSDDHNYVPPFRGMPKRVDSKRRNRQHKISDDELRQIWQAAESAGTYGAFIRVLVLSGQRRQKVRDLRWADISPDGAWTIPTEEREKGNPGTLRLPRQALAVINALPRFAGNDYVFATGAGAIGNFGRAKANFDKKLAEVAADKKLPAMPPWVLHDLRRVSRTLMARAGVRPDIAERVLGHSIRTSAVEGVYDVHSYTDEMGEALQAAANLLDRILEPSDNVVPMHAQAP